MVGLFSFRICNTVHPIHSMSGMISHMVHRNFWTMAMMGLIWNRGPPIRISTTMMVVIWMTVHRVSLRKDSMELLVMVLPWSWWMVAPFQMLGWVVPPVLPWNLLDFPLLATEDWMVVLTWTMVTLPAILWN